MGIFIATFFRGRNSHFGQHVDGLGPGVVFAQPLVQDDGFHDLIAYGEDRIQGSHRFLENHGYVVAPNGANFFAAGIELGQVLDVVVIVKENLAASDAAGWPRNQTHDGQGGDGFA